MADDLLDLNIWAAKSSASQVGDTVLWGIVIIFLLILVGLIVWLLIVIIRHKHKFRVNQITKGVKRVFDDRARILRDTDGVEKWKLLKMKKFASSPPKEAMSITTKGKFSVEADYSDELGFEYIYPKDKDKQVSTEAFTTNQKIFMVNEYRKAELERPKKLGEMVMAMLPYMTVIIIVALFLFTFADNIQPSIALAQSNRETMQLQRDIVQDLKEIEQGTQSIDPEKERPD